MDIQSPLSFIPSDVLDHVVLEVTFMLKIGLKEQSPEAVENFLTIAEKRIGSTGARVMNYETKILKLDPYCGSLREKLLANEQEKGT